MEKKKLYKFFLYNTLLWLIYLPGHLSCLAQTTNISGTVNSYYSIIEVIPAKACVRVSSVAGLTLATKVLIIQMKGGSINTASTSSSSWGDTTNLNNAGNYEVNYICYTNGDSVFLVYNLLNTYTAPAGKVQLVTFARYQNANVTGTVTASPWDNTTGTGGIIAIDVVDTLTLNASIAADSAGYTGGVFFMHNGNCPVGTFYAYDATTSSALNGAYKGEGIADIAANVDGGKGAPANGGGGGNNHNNSGAGGANLTAGGRGGGNSSNGPITCNTGNNFGLGGKALSSWSGTKIFAGGGGGAGHNNNGIFQLGGGDGGGIIFIHADTLIGNGHKISASAANGGRSQGDGAGGGGGGGTIIMDVYTYLGSAIIQANGGNGGNSDDVGTPGRCFGGGGGGSGGVIYFTGAPPALTIIDTAGTGGTEVNRSGTCVAAVPGLIGINGPIIPNYTYRQSGSFAASCGTPLPSTLVSFKASLVQKRVGLYWRMLNPELVKNFVIEKKNSNGDWTAITTIIAEESQGNYQTTDNDPSEGDNLYRLKITEKTNTVSYSSVRHIFMGAKEEFTAYPNPALDKITIQGHFAGTTTMKLLDITGKTILQRQLTNPVTEIRLPSLSNGVYLLRIGTTTIKMVIR
jgi:Secretion system C-terminal sorting domain